MPLPFIGAPANEAIARGALPGRPAKCQARQQSAGFMVNGIGEILADGPAAAQIMKSLHSRPTFLPVCLVRADLADRQWSNDVQRCRLRTAIPFADGKPSSLPHHPIR